MTAVIDGVMVTGTPEQISYLIKIHNAKIGYSTGTQAMNVLKKGD